MALQAHPLIHAFDIRGNWDDLEQPIEVKISLEVEASPDTSMTLLHYTHPAIKKWHEVKFTNAETHYAYDSHRDLDRHISSLATASVIKYSPVFKKCASSDEEISLPEQSPTSLNPLRDPAESSDKDACPPFLKNARGCTMISPPELNNDDFTQDFEERSIPSRSRSPQKGKGISSPQKRPVSITLRPPWGSPVVEVVKRRGRLETKKNPPNRKISHSAKTRDSSRSVTSESPPSTPHKILRQSMIPRRRLHPSRSLGNLQSTQSSHDNHCASTHGMSVQNRLPIPEFKRLPKSDQASTAASASAVHRHVLVSDIKVDVWLGDSTDDCDSFTPSKVPGSRSSQGSDDNTNSVISTAQNRFIGAPQDVIVDLPSSGSIPASPSPSSQEAIPWTAAIPLTSKHQNGQYGRGLLRGGGVLGDISSGVYCVDDGSHLEAKFTEKCLVRITTTASVVPQVHPQGGYILEIPGLSLQRLDSHNSSKKVNGVVAISMGDRNPCRVIAHYKTAEDAGSDHKSSLWFRLLLLEKPFTLDPAEFEVTLKSVADEVSKAFTICFNDKLEFSKGAVLAWAPSVRKSGLFEVRESAIGETAGISTTACDEETFSQDGNSCDTTSSPADEIPISKDAKPWGYVGLMLLMMKYAVVIWLILHAFFKEPITAAERAIQHCVASFQLQLEDAMHFEQVACWDDVTGWRSLRKQYKQRAAEEASDSEKVRKEDIGEDAVGELEVAVVKSEGQVSDSEKEHSTHPETLRDFLDYLLGYRGPDGSWNG